MFKILHRWLLRPIGVNKNRLTFYLNFFRKLSVSLFTGRPMATAAWPETRARTFLRSRQDQGRRFEADARELIARFGGQAYYEAEQLSKGYGADSGERSRLHWARVKIEIARLHEPDIGLSGAVRWE